MNSTKVLKDIVASATGAKTHYDLWWAQVSDAKPTYARVTNRHSDFFLASQDAHFKTAFVYFDHLFDKREDSSSIPKYLDLIKKVTEQQAFQELNSNCQALAVRAKPVLIIRHKLVAHIETKLSENDIFADINLTWNEIRNTIHDVATYVEKLAGAPNHGAVGIPRDGRLSEATLRLFEELNHIKN